MKRAFLKPADKFQAGFTLIELLVVIAVLGLMASVVMIAVNSARIKSRDAIRVRNLKTMAEAASMYLNEYGQCPPITTVPTNPNQLNITDSGNWNQELTNNIKPFLPTMPKTVANDTSRRFGYDYAYNNAYMGFMFSSPTSNYCLSLTKGGCFLSVNLEDANNMPKDGAFSMLSGNKFHVIVLGRYKLVPVANSWSCTGYSPP